MERKAKAMLEMPIATKYSSITIGTTHFSDADIVHMYDLLLSPEHVRVQMPDIASGRTILFSFLQSLDYYHDLACITAHSESLPLSVLSLLDYWQVMNYLPQASPESLSNFLLQECTNDFIWVEYDATLQSMECITAIDSALKQTAIKVLSIVY